MLNFQNIILVNIVLVILPAQTLKSFYFLIKLIYSNNAILHSIIQEII